MKEIKMKTFLISGVLHVNFCESRIDDLINEWIKENQDKISIKEKILDTSTTTFSTDKGQYHLTVITVCVMIFYHLV